MKTEASWLLTQLLGIGECLIALLFIFSCGKNSKAIRSVFHTPRLFLVSWFALSMGAISLIDTEYLLLTIGLSGGVIGALCHPAFATSLLVGNLLMRPWEALPLDNPFIILPRGLAALCLISLVLEHIRQTKMSIRLGLPIYIFVALASWLALSAKLSFQPSESTTFLTTAFIPASVIVLVIRNAVVETWSIKVCLYAFAIATMTVAASALAYTGQQEFLFGAGVRLGSFGQWGNSNDLAALFATALPVVAVWSLRIRTVILRIFLAGPPLALLGLSLLLTQSRGGLLAVMSSLVPYLYDRRRKPAVLVGGIVCAMALFVVSTVLVSRDARELEGSKHSRLNYVVVGLKMLRSSPLFGVGPGNYPVLYDSYSTDFSEYGLRTAHSCWVLIMAEGGIVGIFFFVTLIVSALRSAIDARSIYPELLMSFIAYFVAVSFLSQSYSLATYFIVALAFSAMPPKPLLSFNSEKMDSEK